MKNLQPNANGQHPFNHPACKVSMALLPREGLAGSCSHPTMIHFSYWVSLFKQSGNFYSYSTACQLLGFTWFESVFVYYIYRFYVLFPPEPLGCSVSGT